RYALTGGGSLAESYVATGGYMRSDPSLAVSDTIVVMIPALVTRSGVGFRLRDLFPECHGFTVLVGSGRPLSRGHILLRNADPTTHPLIFPEYFSEPEDLHSLARSVQRMRDMMGAPAIRDLIEAELAPGPIANDQAAIEADIRARAVDARAAVLGGGFPRRRHPPLPPERPLPHGHRLDRRRRSAAARQWHR